jgi:hypothetical protein
LTDIIVIGAGPAGVLAERIGGWKALSIMRVALKPSVVSISISSITGLRT